MLGVVLLLPWLLAAPLLELDWDVPEGCPSEEAFVEMVAGELDAMEHEAPVLQAAVGVERLGASAWRLRLEIRRADERPDVRSFEADSCAAVVRAAAVVVSMRAAAWMVSEPAPKPEPEPVPEPPPLIPTPEPAVDTARPREPVAPQLPPPSQPTTTPTAQAEAAEARQRLELHGWLGLHGGVALGVAPGVGGAVAVEGGVGGPAWRVGLSVRGMPRRLNTHPDDADIRGRFDLVEAQVLGCGEPAAGPVSFPLCARVAGGGLRATASGAIATAAPGWRPWWGLGGSGGVVWHVHDRWAPVFSAEALAPLQQRTFSVGTLPSALHRTGSVAFRAWLGLELSL